MIRYFCSLSERIIGIFYLDGDIRFIDAKDLLFFDYDGKIDEEKTAQKITKAFKRYPKMVVPGFYGANPAGKEKLLGRGGSDITGAILAKMLQASSYENWTSNSHNSTLVASSLVSRQ